MELHQVVGLIICTGIVLGIIVPIVATSIYPRKEAGIFPELIYSFIKQVSLTSKELVYEKNYTVKPGLYLNISIEGGGVSIDSWSEDYVLVKIYRVPEFFNIKSLRENRGRKYSIEYNDTINTLYIEVLGYSAEIYVPREAGSITIYCSGGAVDLSMSSPKLENLYIDVSGGAVDARLDNLGAVKASFSISGGVLNALLQFTDYTGESRVFFKVSGGVLNAEIKVVQETKARVYGTYTSGFTNVELDGERIRGNYVEEGYVESGSKLTIEYSISGGIASIGIRR